MKDPPSAPPSAPLSPCVCASSWWGDDCLTAGVRRGCDVCGWRETWCVVDFYPCYGVQTAFDGGMSSSWWPDKVIVDAHSYKGVSSGDRTYATGEPWTYCTSLQSPPSLLPPPSLPRPLLPPSPSPQTPAAALTAPILQIMLAAVGGVLALLCAFCGFRLVMRRIAQLKREKERLMYEQQMLAHELTRIQQPCWAGADHPSDHTSTPCPLMGASVPVAQELSTDSIVPLRVDARPCCCTRVHGALASRALSSGVTISPELGSRPFSARPIQPRSLCRDWGRTAALAAAFAAC